MKIDETLILRLEELARLELSPEERITIRKDLENILQMVAKLETVDTKGVEPLTYISEETNVLRLDEVKNELERSIAMQNAPDTDGTYFKVPKVIDL
ncbi:MAG: Asp-tRNA(Asn)/Glu-tRNA(Gln) amidotransferase subunit GatC [Bacteroidota bacterium]